MKKRLVLSVDGGGIRGLIAARFLSLLEAEVGPLHRRFDLVAGTSTGAILASTIAATLPAATVASMYWGQGPKVFRKSALRRIRTLWGVSGSKYTSDALEDALRAVLGDLRACDTATPLIVTSYNATKSSSKFFKSWNSDTRLVDVCLASSAAPTFFEPHEIGGELFIDGGVHSNNPAICAYVDAITVFEGDDIRVLSIGGGPEDYVHVSKGWGLINWAKAIIPVFMNSADSTTVYQMQQLLGDKFLRINPSHRCALDDVSRSNLVAMVEEGERLWEENREAVLKMLQ